MKLEKLLQQLCNVHGTTSLRRLATSIDDVNTRALEFRDIIEGPLSDVGKPLELTQTAERPWPYSTSQ